MQLVASGNSTYHICSYRKHGVSTNEKAAVAVDAQFFCLREILYHYVTKFRGSKIIMIGVGMGVTGCTFKRI